MGHNICMLAEREFVSKHDVNHTARIELQECIHFHIDLFRFVWASKEFVEIAKMFNEARVKLEAMGTPEATESMNLLGGVVLEGKCLHHNRAAAEITKDGTLHTHVKNLRLHTNAMDFYEFADCIGVAKNTLCHELKRSIDITVSNMIVPSVATVEYLPLLSRYDAGEFPIEAAEDVVMLRKKIKWYLRHPMGDETTEADIQRPSGYLPSPFPGTPPVELNNRYLFSLYESIKKWGYASGPFFEDFMPAFQYPDGRVYLKGAHRTACLLHLGFKEIDVILSEPPSGWSTEG